MLRCKRKQPVQIYSETEKGRLQHIGKLCAGMVSYQEMRIQQNCRNTLYILMLPWLEEDAAITSKKLNLRVDLEKRMENFVEATALHVLGVNGMAHER